MDMDQKLGNMSDRELIIFIIGEVRAIKKTQDGHLNYHDKQDSRHWKIFLALLITSITVTSSVLLAVLC